MQTVFAGYTAGKFGGALLAALFDRQCRLEKNPRPARKFDFSREEYDIALEAAKRAAEKVAEQTRKDEKNV